MKVKGEERLPAQLEALKAFLICLTTNIEKEGAVPVGSTAKAINRCIEAIPKQQVDAHMLMTLCELRDKITPQDIDKPE
ncbi:MAG: hypothetical protein OXC42_07270 [Gammaproteobacteria bacterium]|nr:hypothetical protein [Gammaproteobacteria bacterium]